MRFVFLLVMVIGLGLAGFAVFQVMQQFQAYQAEIRRLEASIVPPIETTNVIVATTGMRFGSPLTRANVTQVAWPTVTAPPNVFSDMDVLFGPEGSPPRSVTRVMEPGEPILVSKVTNIGQPADLRSLLAPGMRAFTIGINATSGVAGFLQPGDRVDILWTGTGTSGRTETRILGQGVEVIAIDQTADQEINRPQLARTVTLQVSQGTVAQLVQAQQTGNLTLSLRGLEDTAVTDEVTVAIQSDVIGTAPQAAPAEPVCTRTIRRGLSVVEEIIPCVNTENPQ
jgi:pilus assembly protein CpaB